LAPEDSFGSDSDEGVAGGHFPLRSATNDRRVSDIYTFYRRMKEVQDHYFREAKREGYLSRAAYKLIEIDDRKKLLRRGDAVLDCGAAPGSWLQVASLRVGEKGIVVGIDLQPIRLSSANVRTMEGDLRVVADETLLAPIRGSGESQRARLFDVILSDMAPSTTGDPRADHFRSVQLCEMALDRAGGLLKRGGNLVMKVFEGESYPALLQRCHLLFESCKGFKPKASRSESVEMYIVAQDYRGPTTTSPSTIQPSATPSKRRPSGWQPG
jgi:23S rRNA (uridine2552-2'-O)-methyltransferase